MSSDGHVRVPHLVRFWRALLGYSHMTCGFAVSPTPGKASGLEVLVQGKQIKAVTEFLLSRGVPKKWIEAAELAGKK